MDSTAAGLARRASSPHAGSRSYATAEAVAAFASLTPRRSLLAVCALTLALLTLFATAGAQRASACVSPAFGTLLNSTFEGNDGDQCDSDDVGPRRDWQNVASSPGLTSTIDAPSNNDTIYGSNNAGLVNGSTNENVPDSWNFTNGNIGAGKFDALAAYSYTDPENGKLFLDLGFVRATTTGETFLAFELNQRQPGYRLDANEADPPNPFSVPTRTAGDLLVTYNVSTAGAQTLGLCVWDGNEHTGRWEVFAPDLSGAPITNQSCPEIASNLYQAALNDGVGGRQGAIPGIENYLNPGVAISAGQFGEAVVNLTDALRNPANQNGPQPCVDFGYVWLHSRSTDELSSNQQDFILPDGAVSIGNCVVEGSKFNDLDGDGTQSVDEPYLGGWTIFVDYDNDGVLDNNMDATFVNDFDGLVEPNEEEPFDVTADGTGTEPLGSYRITKVQPSNIPNADGTWPIREVLQSTWECTAPGTAGGGAVVGCPEDTSTNPDNALGYRLAWTDNQIHSDKDFGNQRQTGTITVVKDLIPSTDPGRFDLRIDGNVVRADAGDGDASAPIEVIVGTHTVSEVEGSVGDVDDYTSSISCSPGGASAAGRGPLDVVVTDGANITCTVTNTRETGTITVVKDLIPSTDPGRFDLRIDGNVVRADAGDNDASGPVTVNTGTHTVSEVAGSIGDVDDYTSSISCSPGGASAAGRGPLDVVVTDGANITCTVTNTRETGTITVVKDLIPSTDPGRFDLRIDGNVVRADAGDNDASGPVTVNTGTHTVSEVAGSIGDVDDYTSSISCTPGGASAAGRGPLDVVVTDGANITCTVTNTRETGTITVVKDLIPSTDPGRFDLRIDGNVVRADAGDNDASGPVTVNTGTHTVSEVAGSIGDVDDYTSSISCTPGGASAAGRGPLDVVVTDGANITCTVTNTRDTTLTVVKDVDNGDGGTNVAADWTMDVTSAGADIVHFPGTSAGHTITINPGAFSVGETAGNDVPAGAYTLASAVGCSGTAAVGSHRTCTLVNDDVAPRLTVIKTVDNKHGSTATASDFTIHINGTAGTETFDGADTPGTTKTLHAGTFVVSEDPNPDYSASLAGECDGTLAVGDHKTCTITNTRRTGTITVVKDLIPAADSGRFDLRIDSTVVRSDAGDGDGSGPIEVNTGAHTVSEVSGSVGDVDDYVASIACTPGGTSAPGPGPLDVTVTSGADITCTITNTRKASVTVRKLTDPAGASPQFAFASDLPAAGSIAADGSFSLAGGQSVTTSVAPGAYPVSEEDPRSLGYKLVGLSCTEDRAQNTTVATGAAIATDRNATIHADSGEIVLCTFTNRRVLAQPIVIKAGDTFAYHDGTASYTFSVSNTGNSSLHDVHVSDDRCPTVSSAPTSTTNDNGDSLLDPIGADGTNPEIWMFTCSYQIGAHLAGEANPVVNTATVTATDEFDRPLSGTDQHSTTLLHPSIAIVKTGPASAVAGDLVTYSLAVTNTGDVAFTGPLVVVTDARCEAPPALVSFGSDTSPGTLDPGDSWRYSCSVQTQAGQTTVHNVANVDGTDVNGHHATAQGTADTALTQPAAPPPPAPVQGASAPSVAPAVPVQIAQARLRGPAGCQPPIARFIVTGRRIEKVTFTVDGRLTKVLKKADSKGRYVYTLRRKITLNGAHRVEARIVFKSGSSQKTKTLRAVFTKCRRAAVQPAFTG